MSCNSCNCNCNCSCSSSSSSACSSYIKDKCIVLNKALPVCGLPDIPAGTDYDTVIATVVSTLCSRIPTGGFSGSFTNGDGSTVTVVNGLITNIS